MEREEYLRLITEAMPHGPDEPCTCDGTTPSGDACVCSGRELGCSCDIDWYRAYCLRQEYYG